MSLKKLILFAVAALGIMIFFKTDYYTLWLNKYIMNPNTELSDQMEKTSVEERKEYRYGNLYTMCQYMKKTLDTTTFKPHEPIVLLPPNDFLVAQGVTLFHMPEPAEFYYHTGIKTVWTTSPDVAKASWALVASSKTSIAMVPIKSKEDLDKLLDLYKKYKPAL
jgi:hypothetical protein